MMPSQIISLHWQNCATSAPATEGECLGDEMQFSLNVQTACVGYTIISYTQPMQWA